VVDAGDGADHGAAEPGEYQPSDVPGLSVRAVDSIDDCGAINQIYLQCRMVPADVDLMWDNSRSEPHMVYLVATDDETATKTCGASRYMPMSRRPLASARRAVPN
jgi:hypothetical protein